MLGVQRTTVAASIAGLQRAGLIQSGRGAITVLNRQGVERAACSCRAAIGLARAEVYSSPAPTCED
jgi:DNA-binding GntR family transcriptional regulator